MQRLSQQGKAPLTKSFMEYLKKMCLIKTSVVQKKCTGIV